MTKTETLTKAINKTIENGWNIPFEEPILSITVTQDDVEGTYQTEPYIRFELDGNQDWCVGIERVIFDHGFAKALWGDEPKDKRPWYEKLSAAVNQEHYWQYHLQQLAVAEDRIKYLEENM